MIIKILIFIPLFMVQYTFAMDATNCTNLAGELFTGQAENAEMKFFLLTKKNFYEGQQIYRWNKTSLLKNSNFNGSHPTRIIIHGWKNNFQSCVNGFVKDAYLKKGDFNVFVVDWSDWSRNTNYKEVADLIFSEVGNYVGDFTRFLNIQGNVSFDNMYLIGHSLGAQMAGAAGQFIKPDQYNTIFGLDPAGPSFTGNQIDKRLDRSDAKYVEQISTNMGSFGYWGILGHAAFYPNYGRIQKYCFLRFGDIGCSHSMAYIYFAESINSQIGFCGQECPFYWKLHNSFNCTDEKCGNNGQKALMGGEPSIPKNGTYFLNVNQNPPFASCNC